MNIKCNKKLNPYLYPFKMKPHDILYPQNPVTEFLKTGNLFQTHTKKDWFLKKRLINLPTKFSGITYPDIPLVTLKSMDIANNKLKSSPTFCKRRELTSNQHEEISKTLEESKPSKASLAIPKPVELIGSHPINLNLPCGPCVGPKLRYMTFANSNWKDINLGRPVPEDVSWTRIDRAQEKLDMISVRLKVAMGVFSGIIATTTVHPLDVIKVRLQLFPKKISTFTMLRRIMICEGRRGLYAGLSAGILRQLTYTGSRLYVYNSMCVLYKKEHGKYPDFSSRVHIAIVGGLVGAFMGTPSELALVRMIEVWRLRRSRCSPPCSMACKKIQHPEGVIFKLIRSGSYIAVVAGLFGTFMGTPSELALVRMIEVWRLRRSRCSPPCSMACKKIQHPEGVIFKLIRSGSYIAVVAGLFGTFMGTPSELALVRMIEVWRLRRSRCSSPCSMACKKIQHPEGVIFKLIRIARREGVTTWWRGCVPTLIRSIFISSAQVGVYSEIRQAFTKGELIETGIKLHLYVAVLSSLVSAIFSLPVDNVKTRYQSYKERRCRYIDILNDILRKKGVRYLWKGFLPYYVRQVIHTAITYVVLDVLVDNYVEFQEASHPKR